MKMKLRVLIQFKDEESKNYYLKLGKELFLDVDEPDWFDTSLEFKVDQVCQGDIIIQLFNKNIDERLSMSKECIDYISIKGCEE